MSKLNIFIGGIIVFCFSLILKIFTDLESKIVIFFNQFLFDLTFFSFYSNINYYRGLEPNVIILTRVDKLKFLENEFEILDTQGNYLLIKIADE